MARALVSAIMELLGPFIDSEFKLTSSVKEEVQKLESKFSTIQAVLNDAEKRQLKEEAVKLWLDKLKEVSYEMDDVLDEWNTAMIKAAIEKEQDEEKAESSTAKKRKVQSYIPSFNFSILQHRDIAHKIKEVNEKLDEIERERERYGFDLTGGNAPEVVERPKSTSLVDVLEILGRDKVMHDLVSILLGKKGSEEERIPYVISLVGMGGIGKTTLAQLAYNDREVQTHFDIKMWVCVSDPFDQCKVAKEILESIEHQSPNMTALQSLLDRICQLIGGKRFFLVLDDVWTEDSTLWEPFRLALKYGAQGSRILVTTRKSSVAEKMGSTTPCMINLELLSDEDCWLVFSKIAFFDKDLEQRKQLEDLGIQIANKCKGLPLAAKTLGSLMHFKTSIEQWEMVLSSNLWELEDVERGLFAPLLLSYYDLPSPLKRCFLYCAVFPKDYDFSVAELAFMWMAQRYIESKENMEMEIVAIEYFENLAIRSFFQDFKKDKDGKIIRCKMHDIVHDFAQSMTKNECFTLNSVTMVKSDYGNARHLHLEIPKKAQFPESIYTAKNLRTLILEVRTEFNLSNYLFQHFRCLRTLTLNFLDAKLNELPDSVGTLIHLRNLILINYNVDGLPEAICNLCNLQILKITFWSASRFKKLPQGMGKLINLRHLILNGHRYGLEFPRGIGRLISLRTITYFNISGKDDSEGCKLGELKNLNHLQGTLQIRGLGNVVDVCEAENAQLKEKIHLRNLDLWFNGENDKRTENDVSILNALGSPPTLEYLLILGYQGTTMSPNWTMSFTKLKILSLRCFTKLEHLPPLGKLPFLKTLMVTEMYSLKKVGVEFLGIDFEKKRGDIIKIFPNLKSLEFDTMNEWEEWIGVGGMGGEEEDCITIMPNLQQLTIRSCSKLKSLPDFLHTTPLKRLQIKYSPILSERCQRGTGEDWPKISHIPNIKINYEYVQRDDH